MEKEKRKKYSWRLLRRNKLSEICNSPGKTLKVIPGAAGCWPQFSPSDKTISHRVTESLGNRVSCTLLNVSFTCVPAVLGVLTKRRRYPLIRCLYEGGKFWKKRKKKLEMLEFLEIIRIIGIVWKFYPSYHSNSILSIYLFYPDMSFIL